MASVLSAHRLSMPTGWRALPEASLWRDRSHDNEPAGRLPQLPVHATADRWDGCPYGGEADVREDTVQSL